MPRKKEGFLFLLNPYNLWNRGKPQKKRKTTKKKNKENLKNKDWRVRERSLRACRPGVSKKNY